MPRVKTPGQLSQQDQARNQGLDIRMRGNRLQLLDANDNVIAETPGGGGGGSMIDWHQGADGNLVIGQIEINGINYDVKIPVESVLDLTSVKPVENRAVKAALDLQKVTFSDTGTATSRVFYETQGGVEKKLGHDISLSSEGSSTQDVSFITLDGNEYRFTAFDPLAPYLRLVGGNMTGSIGFPDDIAAIKSKDTNVDKLVIAQADNPDYGIAASIYMRSGSRSLFSEGQIHMEVNDSDANANRIFSVNAGATRPVWKLQDHYPHNVLIDDDLKIAHNLTTDDPDWVLDAQQGKILNDKITEIYKFDADAITWEHGISTYGQYRTYISENLSSVIVQIASNATIIPNPGRDGAIHIGTLNTTKSLAYTMATGVVYSRTLGYFVACNIEVLHDKRVILYYQTYMGVIDGIRFNCVVRAW